MKTKSTYPIEKSPFWKLNSKKHLVKLLETSESNLMKLRKDGNFRKFSRTVGSKIREIREPMNDLKRVLKRLNCLLARIELPGYYTSKKKSSYIDNCKMQLGIKSVLTMDIKNYFPSITKEHVFRCFRYKFQTREDIAWLLSELVCCEGKLPQGSPTSQTLSFFVSKDQFSLINDYSRSCGIKYSQFVDDMTFSSAEKIPKLHEKFVERALSLLKLSINHKKTKTYSPQESKKITGVILTGDGVLIMTPKLRHDINKGWSDISKLRAALEETRIENISYRKKIKTLFGKIQAGRQIEKGSYVGFYINLKKEIKKIFEYEKKMTLFLFSKSISIKTICKQIGTRPSYAKNLLNRFL